MILCALWIAALSSASDEPPLRPRALERAVEVCQLVVESAERQDVPPTLAVALAWNESRLRFGLSSPCGARGPMQVIPRFWCPDRRGKWRANGEHIEKGCDLVEAGVFALSYYLDHHGEIRRALRAYGGTRSYAERVFNLYDHIENLTEH